MRNSCPKYRSALPMALQDVEVEYYEEVEYNEPPSFKELFHIKAILLISIIAIAIVIV